MVSASAKRQAVKRVVEEGVCSERRACRYLGLHRSSCQYRAQEALEQTRKLVKRIVWLSRKYPRYGYRRIRALLMREGWKAGRKFVQRIRRLGGGLEPGVEARANGAGADRRRHPHEQCG